MLPQKSQFIETLRHPSPNLVAIQIPCQVTTRILRFRFFGSPQRESSSSSQLGSQFGTIGALLDTPVCRNTKAPQEQGRVPARLNSETPWSPFALSVHRGLHSCVATERLQFAATQSRSVRRRHSTRLRESVNQDGPHGSQLQFVVTGTSQFVETEILHITSIPTVIVEISVYRNVSEVGGVGGARARPTALLQRDQHLSSLRSVQFTAADTAELS
ncbi:hypothetical protein H6P81_018088 [Aristolochia fimbriata]|uniref:Uncharacterized protein n=1 Tax=Aristolochia fimbriata TaxID=158543 RepID=A0AAV7E0C9_ARIFI|nr:hypothetical protein H6P81_018088 [Aristolochia fimbriata]